MRQRPRRNRKSPFVRALVRETSVGLNDLVYPLFICEGKDIKQEIGALKENYRFSIDRALEEIQSCLALGLKAFILFPVVDHKHKDKTGTYSYSEDCFYLKAIQRFKAKFPQAVFISDVALDPYSVDGHDGLVEKGEILNDESLEVLAKMALAQARAGIDVIGPSDMMDGRVGYIREALDAQGFTQVSIMSYTAKYASVFYGPFRDALDSAPKAGDKKTYQMDPTNALEALREAELDQSEGADFLMVKPALHYLDVIAKLKTASHLPIVAYHVSGEYAMLYNAFSEDLDSGIDETLHCIKRAGADLVITYFAKRYAKYLKSL